ncbi:hypothetical protein AAEX28_05675 [Lentisphaerota bacterium WC36G]|nr:hypothetical protein LJT99_08535 [Lentisphaerae bacterium WC36]
MKNYFFKSSKLFIISILLSLSTFSCCNSKSSNNKPLIISETSDANFYLIGEKEITTKDAIKMLKSKELPAKIDYIEYDKRSAPLKTKLIQTLIKQAIKSNSKIKWYRCTSIKIDEPKYQSPCMNEQDWINSDLKYRAEILEKDSNDF